MRGPPSSGNALRRRRIAQRRTDIPVPRGSVGRAGVGQRRARMGRHSRTRFGGGERATPGHGIGTSAVACIRRSVTQPGEGSAAASLCSEEQINGGRERARAPLSAAPVALNDGAATEVTVTGQ